MKLARGSAANSMTITATTTAMTITGRCSVMPTAVRIESIEKTRSNKRICAIAAPNVSVALAVSKTSSSGMRVRAVMDFLGGLPHQEQAAGDEDQVPPGKFGLERRPAKLTRSALQAEIEHGCCEPDQPSDRRKQREAHDECQADAEPPCAPLLFGRSLLDRIDMKIRLSMPRTTSITINVSKAAQTAGSEKSVRRLSTIYPLKQRDAVDRAGADADQAGFGLHRVLTRCGPTSRSPSKGSPEGPGPRDATR